MLKRELTIRRNHIYAILNSREWPQPMHTMDKKLSNNTLINDSKTLGAHFDFFGGTGEARVTLGLPLPCRTGFAFAIAHMRLGKSALVLVILKRPGLQSFKTFKTFLKLTERYWFHVRLHVEHIPDGKKGSQFHNSKYQIPS